MKRIHVFVKDWYTNNMRWLRAFNPAPCGRWVFIVLVLALVVGSTGGPFRVRAAPVDATFIDTWMVARKFQQKSDETICVGDKVYILVEVKKRAEITAGNTPSRSMEGEFTEGNLIGVDVQASVVDPSIGTVNPPNKMTRMNDNLPGMVHFIFSAKKAGGTTVRFSGKVSKLVFLGLEFSYDTVKAEVDVKVEDCKYKVNTYSRWTQKGGTFTVVARINGALMKEREDKPGYYESEADVIWSIKPNLDLEGCTVGDLVVPTSKAFLTLTPDKSDLMLYVAFDPVKFEPVEISCPHPLSGSLFDVVIPAFEVKPEYLTKRFPLSGDATDIPHELTNFPVGSTNIVLVRVTDQ